VKTRIAVGADIEVMTPGEFKEAMAEHRREVRKMFDAKPVTRTVSNPVTLDAAGDGVIDLGMPGPGRTWSVRRVSAVYQDVGAALAAGIASLVRGNDANNPLNFVERIPNGTQLPASDTFGAGQVDLEQDEHLFIRIDAGTASAPVFGSAQVIDTPKGTVFDLEREDERPKLTAV
jgi:hypothetical protein